MAFKKEARYISVTIDFIVQCARETGLDLNDKVSRDQILHMIGFELQETDTEGNVIPARIDQMSGVNVRCVDKPYLFRKTTVFSGRMRTDEKFKFAKLYDKIDILDVGHFSGITELVGDLPAFDPANVKPNTRKYTKRKDRDDIVDVEFMTHENLEALYNIYGDKE